MGPETFFTEEVLEQLPAGLRRLLEFERHRLHSIDHFFDNSRDPSFDSAYLPQSGRVFRLPCYRVQRKHLFVYGEQSTQAEELQFVDGTDWQAEVLFPVHPTALPYFTDFVSRSNARLTRDQDSCIWAVPTSSTRTLLAWPDKEPGKAVFVKTSLYSPILGDRRNLLRRVACSVGLSSLVSNELASLPKDIGFFFECIGFTPRTQLDGGVIIRRVPQELSDGSLVLAPLFALTGGGPTSYPLLLEVLARSRSDLNAFVEETLCRRFARLWLRMSMEHGLLLEAHGQDLLLALDGELRSLNKFYYRDFEGLQVDWDLRDSLGLRPSKCLPHSQSWHETYSTWGYPYSQLNWYKWLISIYDYLHFVLLQLEASISSWERAGWISGRSFGDAGIVGLFASCLSDEVRSLLGRRAEINFDIYKHLNRFVARLMVIRNEVARCQKAA